MPKSHGRKTTARRTASARARESADEGGGGAPSPQVKRQRTGGASESAGDQAEGAARLRVPGLGGGGGAGEGGSDSDDGVGAASSRSKKQVRAAERSKKKKGKARAIEPDHSDASANTDHATSGSEVDEALVETLGDEPDSEPVAVAVHRRRLEEDYKPVVEEFIRASGKGKLLLQIWVRYKRCEMLKLSKHWVAPTSSNEFVKSFEWNSVSFSDFLHETTTLQGVDAAATVPYAAISFFYMLATSTKMMDAFSTILNCKTNADLLNWCLDYDQISTKVAMSAGLGSLLYLLTRDGVGLYIGQTSTTGAKREDGHRRCPVSMRMEEARAGTSFDDDWTREMVWEPPADKVNDFSQAVLLFLEHVLIVATDATMPPHLNTNPFDRAGYMHITTVKGVDAIVDYTIDQMYPQTSSGVREHTGEHITREWVQRHGTELQERAGPLNLGTIEIILHGGRWAWRVRPKYAALPAPELLFDKGRLPVPLIADAKERHAEAERVRKQQKFFSALPGVSEDRLASERLYGGVAPKEAPKVLGAREGQDWQDAMPWRTGDAG